MVVADRVLSVLPLGDDVYFKTQAETAFTNLCRLLHGMVDDAGYGFPFTLEDIAVCLDGAGLPKDQAQPVTAAWIPRLLGAAR